MQIDSGSIVNLLQGQGLFAEAQAAASDLPAFLDPVTDGILLEQLGIDPGMVIEGLGLTDQVDGLQDQVGEPVVDITDSGLGGIMDKITSFFGARN